MIRLLKIFFVIVLIVMTWGTVSACLDRGVMTALRELWPDPWFKVTIYDTYFAFLTFYLWVFYKETSTALRLLWLAAVLLLGNFTIAAYMLIQLQRLEPGAGPQELLLRRKS